MKKLKAKATRRTAKKARMEKKVNNTCKESNVGHTCKLCHFGMKVKPPKESNVRFKTRKTSLGSKMYFLLFMEPFHNAIMVCKFVFTLAP